MKTDNTWRQYKTKLRMLLQLRHNNTTEHLHSPSIHIQTIAMHTITSVQTGPQWNESTAQTVCQYYHAIAYFRTYNNNNNNKIIIIIIGLTTLNFPVCMMTEILLIGCFLRQSNVFSFNIFFYQRVLFWFHFDHLFIVKDAFCHLLIKLLIIVIAPTVSNAP